MKQKLELKMIYFLNQKQLFPLILLTIFILEPNYYWIRGEYLLDGEIYPFSPSEDNIIALLAILTCYIIYFLQRRLYKYSLITVLVLGFFNIISFTTFRETFSISVNGGPEGIKIQPVAVYAISLTYLLNFKRFNNYILNNPENK